VPVDFFLSLSRNIRPRRTSTYLSSTIAAMRPVHTEAWATWTIRNTSDERVIACVTHWPSIMKRHADTALFPSSEPSPVHMNTRNPVTARLMTVPPKMTKVPNPPRAFLDERSDFCRRGGKPRLEGLRASFQGLSWRLAIPLSFLNGGFSLGDTARL
jgi:hypothetical protein